MIRYKIAYALFGLSSLCKFLGKVVITKDHTIIVDALTLKGYFIVDCHMIKHTTLKKGFQWETWLLPDQYIKDMNKLTSKEN